MEKEFKICFVCSGNTCRSVMAERLLKQIMKEKKISGIKVFSRGLKADGDNITENAKIALKERGANSKDRKSIKLKQIEKDVLYVAMTEKIKQAIGGRVVSMKDLIGIDISDPFGLDLGVYKTTLNQIEKAENILLEKILKIRGEK